MKTLYCSIVLLLYCICATSASNNCCSGPQNELGTRTCSDGTNITGLHCPRYYLISSEMDNFTIDSDGNLIEDESEPIAMHNYCVAKLKIDGMQIDAALVCFLETGALHESETMYVFRAICALLSVLFLIATLIVYMLVPGLRDLQGKCLMNSIAFLAVAMFFLSLMQFGMQLPNAICVIVGYVTMFAFLATFTWLNTISFHIWRTTVMPTSLSTNKKWFLAYMIYSYGVPVIIALTALIAHYAPGDHVKPGIGDYACWFTSRDATWLYFYGPVAFLLIANLVFFVATGKKLWSDKKSCNDEVKMKSLKYKCLLYMKLFFIMGLSWSFEVISFAVDHQGNFLDYIWLITDFINALQGVFIFLILIIFRKRAIRGLAAKSIFCIKFPQQWKTLQDEECEEIVEEQLDRSSVNDVNTQKSYENQDIA